MQTTNAWLSEGAEMLVAELAGAAGDFHCDTVIVGSGYGGSVAAARLAGALEKNSVLSRVFVLERGREYLPGMFPTRFADIGGCVRFSTSDSPEPRGEREGLFDVRLCTDVQALVGNGLGGGSLINAGVMEPPADEVFTAGWPQGFAATTLQADFKVVTEVLGATVRGATSAEQLPKTIALQKLGEAIGARESRACRIAVTFNSSTNAAGVAMQPCIDCGDCVSGCNHQAKNTLDTNYLALARARNARLFTGATVLRVAPCNGGWKVEFVYTDPKKCPAEIEPYELHARRVVLAAGTFGSTEILLRSRTDTFLNNSKQLGKGFSGNGDSICVAYAQKIRANSSAREDMAPSWRAIGPTITWMLRTHTKELKKAITIQELGIPALLRRLFEQTVTTSAFLQQLQEPDRTDHESDTTGLDPLAVDLSAVERTSVYAVMGDDGAPGEMALKQGAGQKLCDGGIDVAAAPGRKWRELPLFTEQIATIRRGQREASDVLGGVVAPNPIWQAVPEGIAAALNAEKGPVFTVHPLGGCRMADNASEGVVNQWGQVFSAATQQPTDVFSTLVVLDGSIIPRALGINPALTIAAIAERALKHLISDWGLTAWIHIPDAQHRQLPLGPRPVREIEQSPATPAPTGVELIERLHGTLAIDGVKMKALLDVRYARINDVQTFFASLPRVAPVTGTLELSSSTGSSAPIALSGTVEILHRQQSRPFLRGVRALWAFALNRGLREFPEWFKSGSGIGSLKSFWYLATHIGEARLLTYRLTVHPEVGSSREQHGISLRAGDVLIGVKRLAYVRCGNPWRQLTRADFELWRGAKYHSQLGPLDVDLSYFAKQTTPLFRITSQQDAPNALGDLAAVGLHLARLILKIHFWSFRRPDGYLLDQKHRGAGHSRPGQLKGAGTPEVHCLDVPAGPAVPAAKILLSRYQPKDVKQENPVMLVHGFSASGSTFAHPAIGTNLVQFLFARGFDVWVLDLRTSVALDDGDRDWTFEQVAMNDLPAAVAKIKDITAKSHVDIVGHCIGAAMTTIALLQHESLHESVGSIVLSQVTPVVEISAYNTFRAYIASYLRQFLGVKRLEAADLKGVTPVVVDRLLSTFVYDDDDWRAENPMWPGAKAPYQAVRHRADAILGQTFQVKNLSKEMLNALDDIYGYARIEGLAETIDYARTRLLVVTGGINRALDQRRLAERFARPVCLIHGDDNRMFDKLGPERTHELLSLIFDNNCDFPPIEHLGHQDSMIGKDAHTKVFPLIADFLRTAPDRLWTKKPEVRKYTVLAPWIGPILGWLRPAADWPARTFELRVLAIPEPSRATMMGLALVPLKREASGLQPDLEQTAWFPITAQASGREPTEPIDLVIDESALASYEVLTAVTVHNDLPIASVRWFDGRVNPKDVNPLLLRPWGVDSAPSVFPASLRLPNITAMRDEVSRFLTTDPTAADAHFWPASNAWGGADAARELTAPLSLTFALASCQYPPGFIDSVVAGRSLDRLAGRVQQNDGPQLLLALGDQVYVDETAGLFEPASEALRVERAYELGFRLKGFRAAVSRLPTYMMLDDHELVDNWEPPREQKNGARVAFERYQRGIGPNRASASYWYSMLPAGVPFFILDTRTERTARATAAPNPSTIIGGVQWDALKTWLLEQKRSRPSVPKFIASPSIVFPWDSSALVAGASGGYPQSIRSDGWAGYPDSLSSLFAFIVDKQIEHVVFLSGDYHLSLAASSDLTHGKKSVVVHTIVSSGLFAPYPFANQDPRDLLLDGTFSLLTVSGTIRTLAVWRDQGFAVIRLRPGKGGTYSVTIAFDGDDGLRTFQLM